MKNLKIVLTFIALSISISILAQQDMATAISSKNFDPATLLWYEAPATKWEDALPVGNGRIGDTDFGRNAEERIQLNEETY